MSNPVNNTLTKADIVATLIVAHGVTKVQAVDIMNTVAETILNALENGKTVEWYQMFKIKPEWKPAHKGFNPKTQEEIQVPAKWTVSMSLSKTVKAAVKNLPAKSDIVKNFHPQPT